MKRTVLFLVSFLFFIVPLSVQGQSDSEKKGDMAFKKGEYAKAENYYKSAKMMSKNDVLKLKIDKANQAATLQKEAEVAWGQKKWNTAMQKYEALLELNADDQIALSRVEKLKQLIQLDRAMNWYSKGDYAQALECFNKAGSSTGWNSQQREAYKRCQMENEYKAWKTLSSEELAVSRAKSFIVDYSKDYPNSLYIIELRDYLFNHYKNKNEYGEARFYATEEQKRILDKPRKTQGVTSGGVLDKHLPAPKLWEPTLGIAPEVSLFGSVNEAALPIEIRLFNPNSVLNISFGASIGIRGMLLPDTLRYADENTSYTHQIEASYSYCHISPFVSAKLHLGKDISSGAFFLGVTGRLNYNFNYTFYKTESELNRQQPMYSNKFKYHTKDVLVPITSTIVGELGYGSENIEFYIYYSYDMGNPMDFSKIVKMRSDVDNPHYQMLSLPSFIEKYSKYAFWGAGIRFYFGD